MSRIGLSPQERQLSLVGAFLAAAYAEIALHDNEPFHRSCSLLGRLIALIRENVPVHIGCRVDHIHSRAAHSFTLANEDCESLLVTSILLAADTLIRYHSLHEWPLDPT